MKTKKLLSVILSLVITISSLSFGAVSASAAEITPKEPDKIGEVYQIGTKEELYWFADKVNNDNANYGNASAVLTADITVNSSLLSSLKFDDNENVTNGNIFESWTPIGNDSNTYSGTFDGQGHTVSGLYFNDTNTNFVSLFGYLGSGGEIKNVGVIDSYFNGRFAVGGVCGWNKGTITGCYNTGTVSGSGNYVGGVCGRNDNGTLTDCYNTGTVSGTSNFVGGVCGENYGTITGCYNTGTVSGSGDIVGGVCGYNWSTITDCYNTGTVSGSASNVGGVCGRNYNGTITGCYNTGAVSGTDGVGGVCGSNSGTITDCYNTGKVGGTSDYVGGVCGFNDYGTMTGCDNTGTVSGDYYVGGVCGSNNNGTMTLCYNTGTVSGNYFVGGVCGYNNNETITGCYNTGTVSGTNNYVGGVCGYNTINGTITACYNTGKVGGTSNYVGGVCGSNNSNGTITGCYTNSGGVYGYNSNGTVTNCAEYTGNEFKDGTVCVLLNNTIRNLYNVMFYQGEEIPVFLSKISYQYCTVNYAVAPTYTVTIPETVTLGHTATIKAEDVILEEEKQLKVKLTGTSGENNAFKVRSAEGAELEYTVNDGTKDISIDETVLTVNPDNSANGSAELKFNAPSDSDIIYAGKYTGTVTFTVSVADTQNS